MSANIEETKWYAYTSSTQTIRTWARQIKSADEMPDLFKAILPQLEEPFPYTIFMPEDKASKFQQRNAKLFALFADHFTLWESVENELITLSSPFTEVFTVVVGTILLKSWLKIETVSDTFEMSFNTTNDHLFNPITATIRQKMVQTPRVRSDKEDAVKPDLTPFDFLEKINFKFKNYGSRSVRDQDSVLTVVYQPEQNLQDFHLFKRSLFRRYKTDFLIVLIQEELILIQEDKAIRTSFDPAHGGVFTYIPRHQIQAVAFVSQPEGANSILEISLPNDAKLMCELSVAHEGLQNLLKMKTAVST